MTEAGTADRIRSNARHPDRAAQRRDVILNNLMRPIGREGVTDGESGEDETGKLT